MSKFISYGITSLNKSCFMSWEIVCEEKLGILSSSDGLYSTEVASYYSDFTCCTCSVAEHNLNWDSKKEVGIWSHTKILIMVKKIAKNNNNKQTFYWKRPWLLSAFHVVHIFDLSMRLMEKSTHKFAGWWQ